MCVRKSSASPAPGMRSSGAARSSSGSGGSLTAGGSGTALDSTSYSTLSALRP